MGQTTIILGAGASADFGLPLGSALFEDVQSALAKFRDEYRAVNERHRFFDASSVRSWAQGDELAELLCKICSKPDGGITFSPMFQLVDLMEQAPAYTIDTLAMEKPEHTEICRIMTARVLIEKIRSMIEGERHQQQKWRFCSRDLRQHPTHALKLNWMTLFVTAMRGLLRQGADEQFRFVSFNYDKIAENGMRRIWSNASQDLGKFDEQVQFTYPHGHIHWEVDPQGYSNFSIGKSPIVFAHNKTSEESFETAIDWIGASQRVISLGFHFSPENTKSLRLRESMPGIELVYQNFDDNPGLRRRVDALGVGAPRAFSGTIADAILRGELGELPT